MIIIYRCSFCNKEFENEVECLTHENTHGRTLQCKKLARQGEIECACTILSLPDSTKMTFTWKGESRPVSHTYMFDILLFKIDEEVSDECQNYVGGLD